MKFQGRSGTENALHIPAGTTPYEAVTLLVRYYTDLPGVPNIDGFRRIKYQKHGRCAFRGCSEPIAWEDDEGKYFLCDGHYREIREWIESARAGHLPLPARYHSDSNGMEISRRVQQNDIIRPRVQILWRVS